jgi:hypothetical protein
MFDSTTHIDARDGALPSLTVPGHPPSACGEASTQQQPNGSSAPGRKPLFRS